MFLTEKLELVREQRTPKLPVTFLCKVWQAQNFDMYFWTIYVILCIGTFAYIYSYLIFTSLPALVLFIHCCKVKFPFVGVVL